MNVYARAAVLAPALALLLAADGKESILSFKVSAVSKLQTEAGGRKTPVESTAAVGFTLRRTGDVKTVTINDMMIKAVVGGKETMNSALSRARIVKVEGGKTTSVRFQDASKEQKELLADTFGAPVCKLRVDATGKVLGRTDVAAPAAKPLVEQGTVSNVLLFHAPFYPDKTQWQTDAELNIGGGGLLKGTLTYTRGRKDRTVRVTGALVARDYRSAEEPGVVRSARYVVTGEQTWSAGEREWTAGKLSMQVRLEAKSANQQASVARGTVEMTLKTVPTPR
jgi:hypothetical protein